MCVEMYTWIWIRFLWVPGDSLEFCEAGVTDVFWITLYGGWELNKGPSSVVAVCTFNHRGISPATHLI